MRPTRRTFMQSTAATLASLFGLEAAEEMLGPRKVMVPGITFDDCLAGARKIVPATAEQIRKFAPYRTKNYNPARGALQQELVVNVGWRTGDWMGREGASVGELMGAVNDEAPKLRVLPSGCVLGPRAKLVFVDEARKTLRFELAPAMSEDFYERASLGRWPHLICPP